MRLPCRPMRKCFAILCAVIAGFLVFATHVRATGEFQEDYDVEYDVSPAGITIVTQNIQLTNNVTNLYPQKYSITIDSEHINNIIAYDGGGIVTPEITQANHKTQIALPFNQQIIGVGKKLKFSLRYEDSDIARKNGTIWEVTVPGIKDDPNLTSYNVMLKVPPTFGPNAYLTPLPSAGDQWTKEQMLHGGISAAYGISQSYDLNLSYFLQNTNLTTKTMELSLPPNTAYQSVFIRSLDPPPTTVLQDADGNWLAQYAVGAASHLEVHANLSLKIQLHPPEGYVDTEPDKKVYTRPEKYWESDNPKIKAIAQTVRSPRDIYNYVVSTLTYDYKRVSNSPIRKGALQALETPTNSICTEFTDLFVATARASGIPAREVIGYAYTTNSRLRPLSLVSDVLHAWPEYYDETQHVWVPVDPTWANTTGGVNYFDKLDFNHITFALQGKQSDYPYPAGFYKKNGNSSKDVDVQFSKRDFQLPDARITSTFTFPKSVISGFSAHGSVVLMNSYGVAATQTLVNIQSTPFDVGIVQSYATIPPFARIEIPISIPLPGYFINGTGRITASINGESATYTFAILPLISKFIIPLLLIFVPVGIVLTALFVHRSSVWKQKKK